MEDGFVVSPLSPPPVQPLCSVSSSTLNIFFFSSSATTGSDATTKDSDEDLIWRSCGGIDFVEAWVWLGSDRGGKVGQIVEVLEDAGRPIVEEGGDELLSV